MNASTPFAPEDCIIGLLVAGVLIGVMGVVTRNSPERGIILVALLYRLVMSVGFSVLSLYFLGGGDLVGYHDWGIEYARILRTDLAHGSTEYLSNNLFCLPGPSATYRAWSLSGLIHVLVFDSFLGTSFVFAGMGYAGVLLLYRVFVAAYPDRGLRVGWQVGLLFLPTFTLWTSGLLKDTLGLLGLGCAVYGIHSLLRREAVRGTLAGAFGCYTLWLYRPYVIPVLLLASVPWVLLSGREGGSSPNLTGAALQRSLLLMILICAWLAGADRLRSDLTELPRVAEQQRGRYLSEFRDVDLEFDGSWLGMLLSWPGALVYALYRPFLWEASSALRLVAALENTALLLLTIRGGLQIIVRPGRAMRVVRSPLFLTCVVFVLGFSLGIGMATPNLGTISRYRIPLLPFFVGVLVLLNGADAAVAGGGLPRGGNGPRFRTRSAGGLRDTGVHRSDRAGPVGDPDPARLSSLRQGIDFGADGWLAEQRRDHARARHPHDPTSVRSAGDLPGFAPGMASWWVPGALFPTVMGCVNGSRFRDF